MNTITDPRELYPLTFGNTYKVRQWEDEQELEEERERIADEGEFHAIPMDEARKLSVSITYLGDDEPGGVLCKLWDVLTDDDGEFATPEIQEAYEDALRRITEIREKLTNHLDIP